MLTKKSIKVCLTTLTGHFVVDIDADDQNCKKLEDRQSMLRWDDEISRTKLQPLWSNYGSIWRVRTKTKTLIHKYVNPPNNVAKTESHTRKLASYKVEQAFYKAEYSYRLKAFATVCVIPEYLLSDDKNLYLSDLQSEFSNSLHFLNQKALKTCINWLAAFHAFFWDRPDESLHPRGSYWHLKTRMTELQNVNDNHLKQAAHKLDDLVHHRDQFNTIIHGDAKAENVLFNDTFERSAWVDFQYVGRGYGVADLVYLLVSSAEADLIKDESDEDRWIGFYHQQLCEYLRKRGDVDVEAYTVEICKRHYNFCLADFTRFLCGWGTWGNFAYAYARTKEIIKTL